MYIFACLGFLESQKGELTMASGFRVKQDSKAWLRGFTQGPPLSAERLLPNSTQRSWKAWRPEAWAQQRWNICDLQPSESEESRILEVWNKSW